MSSVTIRPTTALLVIDLQHGLAELPTIRPVRDVAVLAGAMADAFRAAGLPVVLINVDGTGSTELLPELGQHPTDHVITKTQRSAFHDGTRLRDHLTALSITDVVIVGVATSRGVQATAEDASALGFHVTVAADATTDLTQEAQDAALNGVFRLPGDTLTSGDVIAALRTHT